MSKILTYNGQMLTDSTHAFTLGEGQDKTLTLGSSTPQTVMPDSGKILTSVQVTIDSTVINADNIAAGVQILGITGTHQGGGGGTPIVDNTNNIYIYDATMLDNSNNSVSAKIVDTVNLTESNISNYFSVVNNEYYFNGSSGVWTSTNHNIDNTTAQSAWTALSDMQVYLNWSVGSEADYDIFTLTANNILIKEASGEQSGDLNFRIASGQTLVIKYQKDRRDTTEPDIATISNVVIYV